MRLSLEDLAGGYSRRTVLDSVSLDVEEGGAVGIIGRNGAGKTTLLRAILNQLPRRSGRIFLDGSDATTVATGDIVRRGVAYVPQGASIFPELSVAENLILVPVPRAETRRRIETVLVDFPLLRERLGQRAGTLSGGERQMLNLARAELVHARIAFLDEPTANLSDSARRDVRDVIRRWKARRMTLLIIEHDLDFVLETCERVIGMEAGKIRLDRATSGLQGTADPDLLRFFGIDGLAVSSEARGA